MDERLADLCKVCNIWMDGEVKRVSDAADEHGLDIVLSAMKRLSISERDKMKYPAEQFQDILDRKLREDQDVEDVPF